MVDFFGVLLPGLYVVASIGFARLAIGASGLDDLSGRLASHLNGETKLYPVVVAVFAAYILGSAIRAFPISVADNVIGSAVRPLIRTRIVERSSNAEFRKLYDDGFPYRAMLEYVGRELERTHSVTSLRALERSVDYRVVFDYWKTYVRIKNPEFTTRLHELEARTRMFHGFLWAALCGTLVALVTWCVGRSPLPLIWAVPSFLIFLIFAIRLRHVRGEEALHVYCAYLVQQQTENSDRERAR